MPKYEFTRQQAQNLKALIMDANIKGSAAAAVVELLEVLKPPDEKEKENDLHSQHNNRKEHASDVT